MQQPQIAGLVELAASAANLQQTYPCRLHIELETLRPNLQNFDKNSTTKWQNCRLQRLHARKAADAGRMLSPSGRDARPSPAFPNQHGRLLQGANALACIRQRGGGS